MPDGLGRTVASVESSLAPDFSDKGKAQSLAGVPLPKLVEEKENFRATLLKEWEKQASAKGLIDPEVRKGMSDKTSYN